MTRFLTIKQVCEQLQLAERTVYDLCRKGKLPGAAKVGGSWRVEEAALLAWISLLYSSMQRNNLVWSILQ